MNDFRNGGEIKSEEIKPERRNTCHTLVNFDQLNETNKNISFIIEQIATIIKTQDAILEHLNLKKTIRRSPAGIEVTVRKNNES